MIVPFEVLFEPFVSRVFLLDVQPCQVRLGVLGTRLVLGRFPGSRLDLGSRLFNHPVDERQSLLVQKPLQGHPIYVDTKLCVGHQKKALVM